MLGLFIELHPAGCSCFQHISPNVALEESSIKQDQETGDEQTFSEVSETNGSHDWYTYVASCNCTRVICVGWGSSKSIIRVMKKMLVTCNSVQSADIRSCSDA